MKNTGLVITILGFGLLAPFAGADTPQPQLSCERNQWQVSGLQTYCEIREMPATFVGSANVDATPLGFILIRGWDQPGVLIRAEVQAVAPDNSTAAMLASEVTVTENAGVIRATGPAGPTETGLANQWQVNYEILMPHGADLTLTTNVGEIDIANMSGQIGCTATVGAITLDSVSGDVTCHTSTGAVSIVLSGDHWDGQGLVAHTNVGSIDLTVPANYSAHLALSTGVGSLSSAIPLPVVQNGPASTVSTDLGAGGSTLNISTAVGAVDVHASKATSSSGSCDSQSSSLRHGTNEVVYSVPIR